MSQRRRTTDSPKLETETTWLDFRDERTTHLISSLISDNHALEQLRDALEDDLKTVRPAEREPEWLDAIR